MDKLRQSIVAALERFAQSALVLRGRKVILTPEIADLYGMHTEQVEEKVSRYARQFSDSFAFRITSEELETLNRQRFSSRLDDYRLPPYAFTEPGTILATLLLNSARSDKIVRFWVLVFLTMRDQFLSREELIGRFDLLEPRFKSFDETIGTVFSAVCRRDALRRDG